MERQKTEFWNGKKVFLTGHTGFKGAWLSLWLEYLGANVSGYSLRPAEGGIFQRLANNLKVASYFNDIRDINAVRAAMKETKPDIVIHMASQPLVRESYVNPEETFETNIMGTVNLLQAAREVENIAAVLVVTSDKCYRNNGLGQFFVETDPLGGHDPYSSSKACQDLIAQSSAIIAHPYGQGRVIGFADNVNFRGYWRGTEKLMANAIFMAPLIKIR